MAFRIAPFLAVFTIGCASEYSLVDLPNSYYDDPAEVDIPANESDDVDPVKPCAGRTTEFTADGIDRLIGLYPGDKISLVYELESVCGASQLQTIVVINETSGKPEWIEDLDDDGTEKAVGYYTYTGFGESLTGGNQNEGYTVDGTGIAMQWFFDPLKAYLPKNHSATVSVDLPNLTSYFGPTTMNFRLIFEAVDNAGVTQYETELIEVVIDPLPE